MTLRVTLRRHHQHRHPQPARPGRLGHQLAAALVGLAVLLDLTGCRPLGGGEPLGTPVFTVAPAPTPLPLAPSPAPSTPSEHSTTPLEDPGLLSPPGPAGPASAPQEPANMVPTSGGLTAGYVTSLAQRPEPAGTASDITLRFMTALQGRRWAAAAAELSPYYRDRFSYRTPSQVAAVLADTRSHAGGDALGACNRTRQVNEAAVAVSCGRLLVVVHVQSHMPAGVQLDSQHPAGDVVAGPHTHAYTTQQP